jgi:putative FmdB family regulatory protein
MPIYEYVCSACNSRFDLLRPMSQADQPARCPNCQGTESRRAPSRCAAISKGSDGSSAPIAGSSGCGSCAGGSCASCHH